jgi:hypothetical protein
MVLSDKEKEQEIRKRPWIRELEGKYHNRDIEHNILCYLRDEHKLKFMGSYTQPKTKDAWRLMGFNRRFYIGCLEFGIAKSEGYSVIQIVNRRTREVSEISLNKAFVSVADCKKIYLDKIEVSYCTGPIAYDWIRSEKLHPFTIDVIFINISLIAIPKCDKTCEINRCLDRKCGRQQRKTIGLCINSRGITAGDIFRHTEVGVLPRINGPFFGKIPGYIDEDDISLLYRYEGDDSTVMMKVVTAQAKVNGLYEDWSRYSIHSPQAIRYPVFDLSRKYLNWPPEQVRLL